MNAELTQKTALAGVAKTRHYGSNQRLTRIGYQAFLVAKADRDVVERRTCCPHDHRSKDAAVKCARKLYAGLEKD